AGTIRDIDRNAHFLERQSPWETSFRKLDVTTERVIDPGGAADLRRRRPDGIDLARENELLYLSLDFIVQFVAIVPEELDPVILVGIVRGGEDDAGVGPQRPCDVSHARSRERTDQEDVHAQRGDSGDERVLEHVAGEPRVFPEHDLGPQARWMCP